MVTKLGTYRAVLLHRGYILKASGNAAQFGKYDRKPWAGQNLVGGVTPEISDKREEEKRVQMIQP